MKNSITKSVIIALSIIAVTISSCQKNDKDETNNSLNINYPAAYVVNGTSNNISVIKLSDNSIGGTFSLNGATYPHHIYINPAKTKLAVAITATDLSGGHMGHTGATTGFKVLILDAITGNIDKEISLSKMPHNAIFNSTGTELWVGQQDSIQSQVLVYKTSDWTLQNTINVGKGLSEVTFSNDGIMVFACNTTDGTVSMIDANSKMIHTTIPVGMNPVGAWSASNGNMYVDNEMSQTISEISVSGMEVVSTIDLGFKPGYVAYCSHYAELWVSDATNGKIAYFIYDTGMAMWMQAGTISVGNDAHAILFSGDGKKAYVTNQGSNSVSVIDVFSHTVIKTIIVGSKPNGIVFKM